MIACDFTVDGRPVAHMTPVVHDPTHSGGDLWTITFRNGSKRCLTGDEIAYWVDESRGEWSNRGRTRCGMLHAAIAGTAFLMTLAVGVTWLIRVAVF